MSHSWVAPAHSQDVICTHKADAQQVQRNCKVWCPALVDHSDIMPLETEGKCLTTEIRCHAVLLDAA